MILKNDHFQGAVQNLVFRLPEACRSFMANMHGLLSLLYFPERP